MRIIADRPNGKLILNDGSSFSISNRVRTLRDGTRKSSEVIRSIPNDLPYDPMLFPPGVWRITGVEWQKEKGFDPKTYGPVKIRTDAWQWVKVWELDSEGDYFRERGDEVKDSGYLLHYTTFNTTLGCIKLDSADDARALGKYIQNLMREGEPLELEVI